MLTVRRVPLGDLVPDPSNPRSHGPENLQAIVASLRRFGQAEPLVVQTGSLRVIAGHGRLAAMRELGWEECDIVEVPVDDLGATSLAIALNRTGELAGWDDEVLVKLLDELKAEGELEVTGFSLSDLDDLIAELEAKTDLALSGDIDQVPEPPDEATTRPGDRWLLGSHVLLCGDSSKTEDVDRLLGGERIHLVNTDPPYNVRVEPRSNNAIAAGLSSFSGGTNHQRFDAGRDPRKVKNATRKMRAKDRPLANDFLKDEDFDKLLRAWFGNMARVLEPGRSFYIWGGYANLGNYPGPLKDAGLYFSQAIVWDKLHPVLTRKDFMGSFELAFYGWLEGAGHQFFGPNNATDLWHLKKVSPNAMCHLTEKPVELAVRAMQYSSRRSENVLDLFGGSGSTLIAAEETGRRAFLMELDGLYCDVILERFEKHTQKKATLDGDGRTFAEVKAERLGEKAVTP